MRSDIREDREGVPLRLAIRIRGAPKCEPIKDAVVDIWHCDATGSYSERGETYLRGLQVTDGNGLAEFTTIYPGWYPGRTAHVHAKVHLDKRTVLTTQFYFDDDLSSRVYLEDPYPGESNRDGFNSSDPLYRQELELTLSRQGGRLPRADDGRRGKRLAVGRDPDQATGLAAQAARGQPEPKPPDEP